MSLLKLPSEVLRIIASYLDENSLISFALSDSRLRDISRSLIAPWGVDISTTRTLLDRILTFGPSIRSLDLSDSPAPRHLLLKVTLSCPRVVEVNVVNTELSWIYLRDAMDQLEEVETLSVSMLTHSDAELLADERPAQRYPSIKNLYIETTPWIVALKEVFKILNRCERIERAHVFLLGRTIHAEKQAFDSLTLYPQRWNTLRIFMLSVFMTSLTNYHRDILRRVLAVKYNRRVAAWLSRDLDCYCYCNGRLSDESGGDDSNKLSLGQLGKKCLIKPVGLGNIGHMTFAWSHAEEIRLDLSASTLPTLRIFEALESRLTTLVGLYISDFHGVSSLEDRRKILASCESLEALAVPICFIRLYPSGADACRENQSAKEAFGQTFRGLKLRILHLNEMHQRHHRMSLTCRSCEMRVTSDSIPQLNDLECLEQLTINGLYVDESAFDTLSNSKAHTIRLNLRAGSRENGLQRFIKKCSNLKRFKLAAGFTSLKTPGVRGALAECEKLEQLCLHLRKLRSGGTFFREPFSCILPKLKVLHIHATTYGACNMDMLSSFKGELLFSDEPPLDYVDEIEFFRKERIPGRALCYSGSFIGAVKPEGWD